MEYVNCNLCGGRNHRRRYQLSDTNYGLAGKFTLVQCRDCELVFLNPRPTKSEIGLYYPESRYHPYKTIHAVGATFPGPTHWRRAHWLTQQKEPAKLLDVGCGNGLFLVAMRGFGWQCVGVEPNEAAGQHARDTLGLKVHIGDVFLLRSAATFDLITLWDVLEHVHSPADVLAHCNRLLKPGGIVALHVPNWDSIERRLFRERWTGLDVPRHLYHFSPRTLRQLLNLSGFRVQTLITQAPVLTLASNVLRWAGDWLYRKGKPKALTAESSNDSSRSPARRRLVSFVHLLMGPPNAVANLMNRGATIMVVAVKARDAYD